MLLLSTRNSHKISELRVLLAPSGLDIRDLTDWPSCPDVIEDGRTLEDNALKKALEVHAHTGVPVLADDSGLEVYYLNGEPGVLSARYAGEGCSYADNNRKLLRALNQAPARRRGARFRTVLAYVAGPARFLFQGVVEGSIAFAPRGSNGFGYDPLFLPRGEQRTYAELLDDEKNRLSHRARAVEAFLRHLPTLPSL